MSLAVIYFVVVYRMFRGKITAMSSDTEIDESTMPCLDTRNRVLLLAGATLSLALQLGSCALAQSAPVSWNHPWHSSDEQQFVRDALAEHIQDLPHNAITKPGTCDE